MGIGWDSSVRRREGFDPCGQIPAGREGKEGIKLLSVVFSDRTKGTNLNRKFHLSIRKKPFLL